MLNRRKVRARVAFWQKRLHLDHWTVNVVFEPKEKHKAHCWVDGRETAFDADYVTCDIYLDLSRIDPAKLDRYILHEFMHPVLWPLGAFAEKLAGKNKRLQSLLVQAEENTAMMLEHTLCAAFGLRGGE